MKLTFHSLRNYSANMFNGTLVKISFTNYEKLDNPNLPTVTLLPDLTV